MQTTPYTPPTSLSCAETAKLVRAALKARFPRVKFSVTSKTYSMGASMNVTWTDGPTSKAVEAITTQYVGSDFDGSIDLKVASTHWLMPDGSVTFASTQGTQGSGGCIASVKTEQPEGAVRVRFGADSIWVHRKYSPRAEALIEARATYWAGFERDEQRREYNKWTYISRAETEFDFTGWLTGGKPTFRPGDLNASWR